MSLNDCWKECSCAECTRMQVLNKYNGGNFFVEEDTLVVQALEQEGLMKKFSWSAKTTRKGKIYLIFYKIIREIEDRKIHFFYP